MFSYEPEKRDKWMSVDDENINKIFRDSKVRDIMNDLEKDGRTVSDSYKIINPHLGITQLLQEKTT